MLTCSLLYWPTWKIIRAYLKVRQNKLRTVARSNNGWDKRSIQNFSRTTCRKLIISKTLRWMGEYLNKTSRNGVWGCGPKRQGVVPIFCDSNDPPVSLISGESLTNQGFAHCTRKTRQREVTFGLRGYRLLCGLFKGRYIIPTSAWKDWRKSWSQSI
jgi:hypothetical protein